MSVIETPTKPKPPLLRRILVRLALLGFSLLLSAVLAEVVLRVVRPTDRFFPYHRNMRQVFTPHPELTPGIEGPSVFSTNGFGCRGPEPAGEPVRLLTIGGSTTACTALDDSETWPHLVMERVNERLGEKRLWVTNSGIDGLNSRHHLMHALYLVPKIPDLDYVLVYAGLNDMGSWLYLVEFDPDYLEHHWDRVVARSFRVCNCTADDEPWYKHLELWKQASIVKSRWLTRKSKEERAGSFEQDRNMEWLREARRQAAEREQKFVHRAKRETLPLALQSYRENLERIVKEVRAAGAEPLFMSQATQYMGLNEEQKKRLWMGAVDGGASQVKREEAVEFLAEFNRVMREVAEETGTHFLDLAANNEGHPEYYYDGSHFNELGARKVADFVSEYLVKEVLR